MSDELPIMSSRLKYKAIKPIAAVHYPQSDHSLQSARNQPPRATDCVLRFDDRTHSLPHPCTFHYHIIEEAEAQLAVEKLSKVSFLALLDSGQGQSRVRL